MTAKGGKIIARITLNRDIWIDIFCQINDFEQIFQLDCSELVAVTTNQNVICLCIDNIDDHPNDPFWQNMTATIFHELLHRCGWHLTSENKQAEQRIERIAQRCYGGVH